MRLVADEGLNLGGNQVSEVVEEVDGLGRYLVLELWLGNWSHFQQRTVEEEKGGWDFRLEI